VAESRGRITATQLRADFDGGFARAHPLASPPVLDLLVVHVADHVYALKLSEVAALHVDRKLTEVPSPRRELLGLVGVRGLVAPVYDLRVLLGSAPGGSPRWLAQVVTRAPFVVAFEHFERHLRVPARDWAASDAEAHGAQQFVRGSVSTPAGTLAVLDLLAIVESLTHDRRAHVAPERGERRP
jgi:chemotaxis signal transduction protein